MEISLYFQFVIVNKFCFRKQNSSTKFVDKILIISVQSDISYRKSYRFLTELTPEKFTKKWFDVHNEIGDLQASGLQPRRILNLLITYDPETIPVTKFTKNK